MDNKQLDQMLDQFVDENKDQFVSDLKELVSVKSVKEAPVEGAPFGMGPKKAMEKAMEIAERYGFETKNYDNYVGGIFHGDQSNHFGAIAHMDVVPEASGWIYEPYNPVVKNGYIIGRGVSDNKGPGISVLYALRFLKENNIELKHGIRLLLGTDEETGMADVEYYLENYEAPVFTLVPDAMYPVCYGEKGIFEGDLVSEDLTGSKVVDFTAGVASNVVPDNAVLKLKDVDFSKVKAAENNGVKVTQEGDLVVLTATGSSAHAAMPEGSVNAIGEACKAAIASGELDEKSEKFMQFVADLVSTYYGDKMGVNCEDEVFGKLTCIGGMMKFENNKLYLNINIRYPLAITNVKLEETIKNFCATLNATVEVFQNSPTHYFDKEHPAVATLTNLFNTIFNRDDKPYVMGGGTYARKFPNAVAFGLSLQGAENPMPENHGGAHQPDEVANLEDLYRGIKLYVKAFMALDEMDF